MDHKDVKQLCIGHAKKRVKKKVLILLKMIFYLLLKHFILYYGVYFHFMLLILLGHILYSYKYFSPYIHILSLISHIRSKAHSLLLLFYVAVLDAFDRYNLSS